MTYLVTLTPLEPYTFGTDQSFTYEGTNKTGKESYLAASNRVPDQTMLLGVLRYLILKQAGLLRTDFTYSAMEQIAVKSTIGPESFSFLKTGQRFGRLRGLSPLFLLRQENGAVLIPNPFHNTAKGAGYVPMRLGPALCSSAGEIRLPLEGEYKAKKGHAEGYLELGSLELHTDLFKSSFVPGNKKTNENDEREEAYYRRERVTLKSGYSFAVLADTEPDALPESGVVYMGLKRAAFRAEARPVAEVPAFAGVEASSPSQLLRKLVEGALPGGEAWYYALSDLCAGELYRPKSFSIIEEKSLRTLETDLSGERLVQRRRRSKLRYHLIRAGSVFSGTCPELEANENAERIGYNTICKLGGGVS